MLIPILQIRKPRLREVESSSPNHTGHRKQSWRSASRACAFDHHLSGREEQIAQVVQALRRFTSLPSLPARLISRWLLWGCAQG